MSTAHAPGITDVPVSLIWQRARKRLKPRYRPTPVYYWHNICSLCATRGWFSAGAPQCALCAQSSSLYRNPDRSVILLRTLIPEMEWFTLRCAEWPTMRSTIAGDRADARRTAVLEVWFKSTYNLILSYFYLSTSINLRVNLKIDH